MNKAVLKCFLGLVLGVLANLVAAQVVSVDRNGDGKFDAFLDQTHGLLWTNGNAFLSSGMNYANAQAAVASTTFEGLAPGTWRLPTLAEFNDLYLTLGNEASGNSALNWKPFSVNANWYWTSDKPFPSSNQNFAFSPFNPVPQGQLYFDTTKVGVWAVTAVPEPASVVLFAMGLAAIGRVLRIKKKSVNFRI